MNTLLPFQPDAMTPAQLAAVSYLARYSGHTHTLYSSQLRRWLAWRESNTLDPLVGIQRAHIELYIRHLGQAGLVASSVVTSMHAVPLLCRKHRPAVTNPRISLTARCQRRSLDPGRQRTRRSPRSAGTSASPCPRGASRAFPPSSRSRRSQESTNCRK